MRLIKEIVRKHKKTMEELKIAGTSAPNKKKDVKETA